MVHLDGLRCQLFANVKICGQVQKLLCLLVELSFFESFQNLKDPKLCHSISIR
eukprot:00363.XXX_1280_1438_1 [CDS] Oithona nana genome sequencing.